MKEIKEKLKDYVLDLTTEENEDYTLFILKTLGGKITTHRISNKLLKESMSFCIEKLKQKALNTDEKKCTSCIFNEREGLCYNKYNASIIHEEFINLTELKYDDFGLGEIESLIIPSGFGCKNHALKK